MTKLHITCPVINAWKYTRGMIDSIQTKYEYKLRVIDQESDDGSQDRCRDLGIDCFRKAPRVSLSEAWNFGINESLKDEQCEYLLIVNNDIIFHKDTIDTLIEAIDITGYAMVTGDNVAPHYRDIETFKNLTPPTDREFDYKPITNWREEGPDFSCFMIKRDFVEKYGYFDENFYPAYHEDCDMHVRMLKSGGHAKRISRAPYYHYGSMTVKINPKLGLGASRTSGVYNAKWGAPHPAVMDGKGYKTPYNDPNMNFKQWKGCEKYETI